MSLIEEALRKHRAENTSAATPTPAPQPATAPQVNPPPLPPDSGAAPSDEQHKSATRRSWGVLLLVLLLLLAAVGVGGWFAFRGGIRLFGGPTPEPAAGEEPVAANGTEAPSAPEAVTQQVADVTQPAEPSADVTPDGAPEEPPEPTAPVQTAPTPAVTPPAVVSPPAVAKPVVAKPVAPPRAPVVWPHLTVTGLIGAGQRGGVAIINGQTISVGDTVEGVKVVAVVQQTVRLSYEGETKLLRVGDATE